MSTSAAPPEPQSAVARAQASPLSDQSYAFLQGYIQRQSGIVLDGSKQYLIEARLLPILRKENIISLDSLCQRLAANTSAVLSRQVVEAMTTNETLFFRDGGMFQALKTEILPALFEAAKGKRRVRIWSAASSTGQEAYSLAMMLDWQLSAEVRGMVRLQQLDLRGSFDSMDPCDLVLCRNVLIYFNIETKKAILGAIRRVLGPGGFLVLGCAETVIGLDDSFNRKVAGSSTFYCVR
jgi:chemotaxis protein methyltransferase CheR